MAKPTQRAFEEAIHLFAGAAVVYVLDGAPGAESHHSGNGTGLLLNTPGGVTVLLTASHVLADNRPPQFSLGGRAYPEGAVGDALGPEWHHPSADVAIARLKDGAAELLRAHAQTCSVVAATDDGGLDEPATFMLVGFISALRKDSVDHERKLIRHSLVPVSYATIIEGLDPKKQRYRARWDEGEVPEDIAALFDVPAGLQPMHHPQGISGGPLWRFRLPTPGKLWAAEKVGAVVGVASAYLEPHELVEPVASWGDWFRATIATIDAE